MMKTDSMDQDPERLVTRVKKKFITGLSTPLPERLVERTDFLDIVVEHVVKTVLLSWSRWFLRNFEKTEELQAFRKRRAGTLLQVCTGSRRRLPCTAARGGRGHRCNSNSWGAGSRWRSRGHCCSTSSWGAGSAGQCREHQYRSRGWAAGNWTAGTSWQRDTVSEIFQMFLEHLTLQKIKSLDFFLSRQHLGEVWIQKDSSNVNGS